MLAKRSWPAGGSVARQLYRSDTVGGARRTVGVGSPRSRTGACDEVWVRLGDNGGMSGRVDLHHHINSTLRSRIQNQQRKPFRSKISYCAGVSNDVLDILGRVDGVCRVRALGGEIGEAGNLEREALAVDDVPVELVELQITWLSVRK